ncbi:MAG: hypothetical protein RIQ54_560 [Candidatus Parcubacteria bacterium]|jgi:sugar-specific transcriptional regulator TrmB
MVNHLKNLGLSDKEAKVYTAMLELGPSSVLEISARTGVNRPTTYVQIESLRRMGLVSIQTKGKKQLFQAESPDQFNVLLEREQAGVEEKKKELSDILPDLLAMFDASGGRPKVRFLEGIEGIRKMQEEFLRSGEKVVYEISSYDDVLRLFPDHLKSFSPRRIENKITSKLIYTSSTGPIAELSKNENGEARYIPSDKMPIDFDVAIYGNTIALISLKTSNISGVFIEHTQLAESFRGLFNFIWNGLQQSSQSSREK